METRRARLSGLLAIFVVLLTASVALGAVGAVTQTAEDDPVVSPSPVCEPVDDPVEGEEPAEGEDDPCAEEPTDEGEDGEEEPAEETPSDEPDPERVLECATAAGFELDEGDTTDETEGTDDVEEKLTGLDNAIAHVLANCVKNPQAPGLVIALDRLHDNQVRHEAHEAEKAARAEAREAAKAERAAAKAAGEHGNGNGHGPDVSHGGGNGVGHGNAGGNGNGNGH